MIEQIILGSLQGIVEWLPFSSEAVLVLAQIHLLGETDLANLIHTALFFHLGTFFAALVYFWPNVVRLGRAFLNWSKNDAKTRSELRFYIIATSVSAVIGYGLLQILEYAAFDFEGAGRVITIGVGLMLLITAVLQMMHSYTKERREQNLNNRDAIIAGIGQGLAALPGVSRSGTTVSVLLLRGLNKKATLQLSFIMSLPIVLGGNIILNTAGNDFGWAEFAGLIAAFVVGLVTIHGLMKMAQKIKFGWFVMIFAILTLIAGVFVM